MPASQATNFITFLANGLQQVAQGLVVSAGAASAGAIPALNAQGKLDTTVFPAGLGVDSQSYPFSEAVVAGALINLYAASGVETARNADATAANGAKQACGFALAAVASGATGTVTFTGLDNVLTGQAVGPAFLGAAGAIAAAPPTTSGYLSQPVGDVVSTTSLHFARGTGTIV